MMDQLVLWHRCNNEQIQIPPTIYCAIFLRDPSLVRVRIQRATRRFNIMELAAAFWFIFRPFGLSGVASAARAKTFGLPLHDPGTNKRLAIESRALNSKRLIEHPKATDWL